jgi:hypothetical protein
MQRLWAIDELYRVFDNEIWEAATWCGQRYRADDPNSLRSGEFQPNLEDCVSFDQLKAAVRRICIQRRRVLSKSKPPPYRFPGRLLLCEYNLSIASGESESCSGGFFDLLDHPPWDTWVGVFQIDNSQRPSQQIEILVSWVPSALIPQVDQGIIANPYECIYWADQPPADWPGDSTAETG